MSSNISNIKMFIRFRQTVLFVGFVGINATSLHGL